MRTDPTRRERFEAVAAEEGLTIESRFVEENGQIAGLGASPEFVGSVFELEVGGVSLPLRVAAGLALVAVDEAVPAAVAPFASSKNRTQPAFTAGMNSRASPSAGYFRCRSQ